MSAQYTFVWSQKALTLKEFVSQYRNHLPVLVRVSQGLCGTDDSTFSFATNEEFYITNINVQKRVVAKDTKGWKLSIPTEYPIRFHKLYQGKDTRNEPLPLSELIGPRFHPGLRLTPEDQSNLEFWVGADDTRKTEIQELEILDFYDDHYLVGNTVIGGEVTDCPQYIPLFLSIKFNIAVGLKHGNHDDFFKVTSSYYHNLDMAINTKVAGNPEIMLYTDSQDSIDTEYTEYTYLEPKSIIACSQATIRRTGDGSMSSVKKRGSVRKHKPAPPKVAEKPQSRLSIRSNKPLPPLPGEGKQIQDQGQQQHTVHQQQPTQMPKITPRQIKSVQGSLNHVQLSQSTCVSPDYQNWTKHKQGRPLSSQRISMPCGRRQSILDGGSNVYQEIPADIVEGQHQLDGKSQQFENRDDGKGVHHDKEVDPAEKNENVEYEVKQEQAEEGSGYMRVGDVPRNVSTITIKGVGECLKLLHMNQHVEKFEENLIDGNILMTLDTGVLTGELGLSQLDVIRLNKFVHEGWRPK